MQLADWLFCDFLVNSFFVLLGGRNKSEYVGYPEIYALFQSNKSCIHENSTITRLCNGNGCWV